MRTANYVRRFLLIREVNAHEYTSRRVDVHIAAGRNDCRSVRLHERGALPSSFCVRNLSGDHFAGFYAAGCAALQPANRRDTLSHSLDGGVASDGSQPFCVAYAVVERQTAALTDFHQGKLRPSALRAVLRVGKRPALPEEPQDG